MWDEFFANVNQGVSHVAHSFAQLLQQKRNVKVALLYIGVDYDGRGVRNGHFSACQAVEASIRSVVPYASIELKNANDFSKLSNEALERREQTYLDLISNHKDKYSEMYDMIKYARSLSDPLLVETWLHLDELGQYLGGFDVVMCSHWLLPLAVLQLKAQARNVNLVTTWLFTDYYSCPFFPIMARALDMTFVGSASLVQEYVASGVDPLRVCVSGIPVSMRANNNTPFCRSTFLRSKHLNPSTDVRTIVISGGGEGLCDYYAAIHSIYHYHRANCRNMNVQVIAITSRNSAQYNKLVASGRTFFHSSRFTLRVEKTVSNDDMVDYVRVSDIYIVKTSGLSPTEGIMVGVPMILLDILGGHERDNALFYEKHRLAWINRNYHRIGRQVFMLMRDEPQRQVMLCAQAHFRHARDTTAIGRFIGQHPCARQDGWVGYSRSSERTNLIRQLCLGDRNVGTFLRHGWCQLDVARGSCIGDVAKHAALCAASASFHKVLLIEPLNYAGHYMLGHVAVLLERFDEAIALFQRSLECDVGRGMEGQFYHMGVACVRKQLYEEAICHLQKALALVCRFPCREEFKRRPITKSTLKNMIENLIQHCHDQIALHEQDVAFMKLTAMFVTQENTEILEYV